MSTLSLLTYLKHTHAYDEILTLINAAATADEFEVMFRSFETAPFSLSQHDFITILKYFKARAQRDQASIHSGKKSLVVIYNHAEGDSYRIIVEETKIDMLFKTLSKGYSNHVIFNTLVQLYLNGLDGLVIQKKGKASSNKYDVEEFNLRIRRSEEITPTEAELQMLSELDLTQRSLIFYRYRQRTTLQLPQSQLRLDLTQVVTAKRYQDINHQSPEYELEVEATPLPKSVKARETLVQTMMKETEVLIKVISQSTALITQTESQNVIDHYRQLLSIPATDRTLKSQKPITLDIHSAVSYLPNNYSVSNKVDGERTFLFIHGAKVYFLTNNLHVKYAGIELPDQSGNGTILDGELYFARKFNRFIYFAFDCLVARNENITKVTSYLTRVDRMMNIVDNIFNAKTNRKKNKTALPEVFDLLAVTEHHRQHFLHHFDFLNQSLATQSHVPIITYTPIIAATGAHPWEIFTYSSMILQLFKTPDITIPYLIDGLVYHPLEEPYLATSGTPKFQLYKWKPAHLNSIDFYIEFEKDASGKIVNVYDNSQQNTPGESEFIPNQLYRICKLHAGKVVNGVEKPELFRETEKICYAYLFVKDNEVWDTEGNIILDKTVVEFGYSNSSEIQENFRWIPLRTRYDKTEIMTKYQKQYGNAMMVANHVWENIKNPLTEDDIDELAQGDDRIHRHFHYQDRLDNLKSRVSMEINAMFKNTNEYMRKITVLAGIYKRFIDWVNSSIMYTVYHYTYVGDGKAKSSLSVLDLGCGRGADLNKFYFVETKVYVGIDKDKNVLATQLNNSAMSQYQILQKKQPGKVRMYFFNADMTLPLDLSSQEQGVAFTEMINRKYYNDFFDPTHRVQFDRINCTFAISYALVDNISWSNFKQNLITCLKPNGYMYILTYDADQVRTLLEDKPEVEYNYVDEDTGETKMLWAVRKLYVDVPSDSIMGVGNQVAIHMAWKAYENETEMINLVDKTFLTQEFTDIAFEITDTGLIKDRMTIMKPFLQTASQVAFEAGNARLFDNALKLFKSTSLNVGYRRFLHLLRYYVVRNARQN